MSEHLFVFLASFAGAFLGCLACGCYKSRTSGRAEYFTEEYREQLSSVTGQQLISGVDDITDEEEKEPDEPRRRFY